MVGAMAARLLAGGFAATAFAHMPAKAETVVTAGARLADSPATDVAFTMVLDAASGALEGRSAPAASWWTARAPPITSRVRSRWPRAPLGATPSTLLSLGRCWRCRRHARHPRWRRRGRGGLARSALRPPWQADLHTPGSGQSSKIANQIAVAGAVIGVNEALAFANAAGLDTVSKGAVGSRIMDIFGERMLSREFASGAPCGTSSRISAWHWRSGTAAIVLPGAALVRQMFSAMAANGDGDGDMGMQGLIIVIEPLNGIHK